MQLLVITLDDCDEFLHTISVLKDHGMNGIVFQTTSLKHALLESRYEDAPIFGSLSKLLSNDLEASHTLFLLLKDEEVKDAIEVVRSSAHKLERKGVMFTLPVSFWEGIE